MKLKVCSERRLVSRTSRGRGDGVVRFAFGDERERTGQADGQDTRRAEGALMEVLFCIANKFFSVGMKMHILWGNVSASSVACESATKVRLTLGSGPHSSSTLLGMGGGPETPRCRANPNCHLNHGTALRLHLLLRTSDRAAATYDQTLLSPCTCDSSFRGP
ncbi:hypothetical protein DPEC_G00255110 [Dallia pectoralis]|uniref:Uncharacterized protein n=1 Tax=Dallia pectoralis TaxID=75939 RepID=A0ACC2FUG2_DALPE|nr:hypothetical protein DPEC_G00255110 [Dallia pectoralis]